MWGATVSSLKKSERRRPWRQVQGVRPGRAVTACCSQLQVSWGPLEFRRKKEAHLREKKGVGVLQGEPLLGLCLKGSYLFSFA